MGFHFFQEFTFGWAGVDLFFVLSGFLITGKLVESIGSPNYFTAFYLKRLQRIVPLYYLVLLIFLILIPALAPSVVTDSMRQLIQDQWSYWAFSVNFIYASEGWPSYRSLLHLWTIACEMQFYLVWPFIVKWMLQYRKIRYVVLFLLFSSALLFRIFIAG